MDKRGVGWMAMYASMKADSKRSVDDEGLEKTPLKHKRIKQELVEAGMTRYGLLKFNSRYLPNIMHDNEHVRGVIYGRFREGDELLNYTDRMVVATDRRIISLNHKPGYTDVDEFTYDIIDGIQDSVAGLFAAVTINSKVSHFTVSFVNKQCAEIFVHYIEKRRLEYFESSAG